MRRGIQAALAAVLLTSVAGCGWFGGASSGDIAALLRARAHAIVTHDETAFMSLLDQSDRSFVAHEAEYFENLSQLPVDLRYTLDGTVHSVRTGGRTLYQTGAVEYLRMVGFDSAASTSSTTFTVVERDGRLLFTAPAYASPMDADAQPWDVTRVRVDRSPHVLLLYEDATAGLLPGGAHEVEAAMRQVDAAFPLGWDHRVVVYLFGEDQILEPLDMSGSQENPGHFAGATVPVTGGRYGRRITGTRVVLDPVFLDTGRAERARLLRHELTHEAMGFDIGDDSWFAEGVATYVELTGVPRSRWDISRADLALASRGVHRMPQSWQLYSHVRRTSDFAYTLSWMACDYLARTRGPEVLARLYAGLAAVGSEASSGAQEGVYRRVLGYGSARLAALAARHLLRTASSRSPT